MVCIFFFKQKTAYEMRISDWSSDVCSSDLNFYRTVVACAKKPGAKKHTPPSRPARCERSRLKPLPQLCGQPPYRVAANRSNAPMPSSTVTISITPSCQLLAPNFNSLSGLPRDLLPATLQRSTASAQSEEGPVRAGLPAAGRP